MAGEIDANDMAVTGVLFLDEGVRLQRHDDRGQSCMTMSGQHTSKRSVSAAEPATAMAHADVVEDFINRAAACGSRSVPPSEIVKLLAAPMMELATHAKSWLRAEHLQSRAEGYARNLIYSAPDGHLSLYALVWLPGQWTPIHDHGSWGVVGVVEGVLEEQNYVRLSPDDGRDEAIKLSRGGIVLLTPGAVSTFVPNPDHIHVTGVSADTERVVSLHLYGRAMTDFNVYDLVTGTRRRVEAGRVDN